MYHEVLEFGKLSSTKELLATYSGITPIGLLTDGHVFQDLTRINLTRSLGIP